MLQSIVPAGAAGQRLGDWLAVRFTYLDAEAWRAEIAAGRVQQNGVRAAAHAVLAAGDLVAYEPPPAAPRPDLALPILLDDGDLVAIDKPPHLVAHRDGAFAQNTFLHELERRVGATAPLHLVHRLDRQTSGVLLLARRPELVAPLQRQFTDGSATKAYLAVVRGRVDADAFVVDAPIGPAPASAIAARRAVVPSGSAGARPARTEFCVLRRAAAHTLLLAVPRTGRTHQIRVHLEHRGHALVGDPLYGRSDADYLAFVQRCKAGERTAERHLLHAHRLEIHHPATGARVDIVAAPPADFAAFTSAAAPARPSSP